MPVLPLPFSKNRIKTIISITLLIVAIVTSCSVERMPAFSEISGDNYTIQVTSHITHGDESVTREYKVKLLPTQKVPAEQLKQLKDHLWYQTDSCFYIMQGDIHIRPQIVKPLATDVINCYEFMLVFNDLPITVNEELTLVFSDEHVTHEQYKIKLNRNK